MRILLAITRADTVGGAQVHVRDLAIALQEKGHEVLVVTGVSGSYNTALEQCGVESVSCSALQQQVSLSKDLKALGFLRQTIGQFQPDLVSTHSSKAGVLARIASRLTKIPCVFTVHGWAFTEGVPEPKRTLYKWIERLSEPLADQIICVSEHDRLIGIQSGMAPERLVTIHNGMEDVSPELRAEFHSPKPIKLVMVARFDCQKDHLTLIQACQGIEEIKLTLVGDGPELEQTKNWVKKLGMEERVNFTGYRRDIAAILSQNHIFALISHWEGFPYTIVEGMRAGLPVVASDVGGVTEAVIDGVTGYCVPRSDIKALRERLVTLVNDDELRCQMGSLGREKYESQFTFKQMFEGTLAVYERVVSQRKKSR